VEDRGEVKLAGLTWSAHVLPSGLELSLVVSRNNELEQAEARRLNINNEIEHRTAEATALTEQRQALLDDMDQANKLFLFFSF
jgi:hypothetical protein